MSQDLAQGGQMSEPTCINTDKEIWRKIPGDCYSPSIYVTEFGAIGINIGGFPLEAHIEAWYGAGKKLFPVDPKLKRWKRKLAYKLLGWK